MDHFGNVSDDDDDYDDYADMPELEEAPPIIDDIRYNQQQVVHRCVQFLELYNRSDFTRSWYITPCSVCNFYKGKIFLRSVTARLNGYRTTAYICDKCYMFMDLLESQAYMTVWIILIIRKGLPREVFEMVLKALY